MPQTNPHPSDGDTHNLPVPAYPVLSADSAVRSADGWFNPDISPDRVDRTDVHRHIEHPPSSLRILLRLSGCTILFSARA